jgi:hypothetical protein
MNPDGLAHAKSRLIQQHEEPQRSGRALICYEQGRLG